jgi:superfamily I DNA/RNA helicase/mRNA-degrading endonuclease RelE of RelBE toxin-antitoxin system
MEFRIADTFVDSLAKLTGQEQKAVKTTAFDLQIDPARPGMQFHKIGRSRDPGFRSVRVGRDLRLIVHQAKGSLLLCYVGHHDDAYRWAERRKLEKHPKTGAAQLVEIRETVREIPIPTPVLRERPAPAKPLLFGDVPDKNLLSYGVPPEWLGDVRQADEDSLLELAEHLPGEAAEALLELATGGQPRAALAVPPADPFDHPDAQRRFRSMQDSDELRRALDYPWEKWTIFLHPSQRQLVEGDYSGPTRVSGSAGTGKTIVALHRAVYLARTYPEARVLLTTFSDTLANALRERLVRLIGSEPRIAERLEVHALNSIGRRLYGFAFGQPKIASRQQTLELLTAAAEETGQQSLGQRLLMTEWEQVVDAWQLYDWESYRDVLRLGRKTRLPESRRKELWSVFERVRAVMSDRGLKTHSDMFGELAALYQDGKASPFDYILVDESQDVSVAQLRFLAALRADRPNGLFFAGDLGQRIFQQPFSWKALGVDVRGRSHTLRVNYRTSHQIRTRADRLLGPELSDVDGVAEDRGAVSVFSGPLPETSVLATQQEEIDAVAKWLSARMAEGVKAHEMAVFVRSPAEVSRGSEAIQGGGLDFQTLDENVDTVKGSVSLSTMHLAKGLEFRAVVVMACDDEVIPLQERIETVSDDSDLEEVYNTERHLLYVACTRARDHLLVTGVEPASEFLEDMSR